MPGSGHGFARSDDLRRELAIHRQDRAEDVAGLRRAEKGHRVGGAAGKVRDLAGYSTLQLLFHAPVVLLLWLLGLTRLTFRRFSASQRPCAGVLASGEAFVVASSAMAARPACTLSMRSIFTQCRCFAKQR